MTIIIESNKVWNFSETPENMRGPNPFEDAFFGKFLQNFSTPSCE